MGKSVRGIMGGVGIAVGGGWGWGGGGGLCWGGFFVGVFSRFFPTFR